MKCSDNLHNNLYSYETRSSTRVDLSVPNAYLNATQRTCQNRGFNISNNHPPSMVGNAPPSYSFKSTFSAIIVQH